MVSLVGHLGSLDVGPHLGGFSDETDGLVGLVCLCVGG